MAEGKIIGNAAQIAHLIKGRHYHSTWSSPEAFARYIQKADKKTAWNDSGWYLGNAEWSGTETMDEALDLALNGWKEGAEKVEKLINKIHALHPIRKKPVKYAMAGALPDVPRAVSGNIMNMKDLGSAASRKRPIITLLCDMGVNCGVSAEAITNRAAVVAAVIDQIESAGYACEVVSTALTSGWGKGGFNAATSVMAKDSNQPVDLKRLAFALGHSSMFRRLIFADWGLEPSCHEGLGHGLGHCGVGFNLTPEDRAKHIYELPSIEDHWRKYDTDDKAMTEGLAHTVRELQLQSCPAFPALSKEEKEKKDLTASDILRSIPA